MSRFRNICFTLNNPSKHNGIDLWHKLAKECSYYVIGFEIGKKCGTPHWQGYAELKTQTLATVVLRWCDGWHVERRKKKAIDAAGYCKKDGKYVEEGTISKQGERTDIAYIREVAMTEGLKKVSEICDNMQQYRLAEVYLNFHAKPRDPNVPIEVIYITGHSGSGKSRLAYQMLEGKSYYVKDEGPWWTGYNGEEYVLLDDFRDSWMTHNQFIKLCDRYPMRVRVHGGLTEMRARVLIFTSLLPLASLYARAADEPRAQILRRVTKLIDLDAEGVTSPQTSVEVNDSEVTEYSEVGVILGPTSCEQNVGERVDDGDWLWGDVTPPASWTS